MRTFFVVAIVGALFANALDVDSIVAIKHSELENDDMLEAELIEVDLGWSTVDPSIPGFEKTKLNSVKIEAFKVGEPSTHPTGEALAQMLASVDKYDSQVVSIEPSKKAIAYKIGEESVQWAMHKARSSGQNGEPQTMLASNKKSDGGDSIALEVDSSLTDELLSLEHDTSKLGHVADKVHGVYVYSKVANTHLSPYQKIGRLGMGCTGSLIGSKLVVTSGHCVYDHDTMKYEPVSACDWIPGQNGVGDKPFQKFSAEKYIVSRKFVEAPVYSEVNDWAIIVLQTDPGLGYFGFGVQKLDSTSLTLAGYPQSKNQQMWSAVCPTTALANDASVTHMCDTEPGNSGSSMILKKDDGWYVRAIHSGGNSVANWACKINTEVFNALSFYRELFQK